MSKESTFSSIRKLLDYTFKKYENGKLQLTSGNYDVRCSDDLGDVYDEYADLGCYPSAKDGLFHPQRAVTRTELAKMLRGVNDLADNAVLDVFEEGNSRGNVTVSRLASLVQELFPEYLTEEEVQEALNGCSGIEELSEEEKEAYALFLKNGLSSDDSCRNAKQILTRKQALLIADKISDYQVRYYASHPEFLTGDMQLSAPEEGAQVTYPELSHGNMNALAGFNKKWMEYLTAYQKDPSSFNTVGDGIYVDESGVPYYLNEKDLYKNFMETSFQMTHNISASGGTDKLRYRISGGYNSNDGVLISNRDKFERMNVNSFISADVTKWFTQEITMSYAHSLQTSPGGMGGVYNTRLVSYYPEGELPASVNTLADEDLPLFTPRNQILYSNPVNNKNDNPRIFLKSILKPLKGLEAVFEYTFDKNIYDYHWYTGQYDYTTIQGGSSKSFVDDYLRKYKQHTNYNSINVYATYNKDFGNHHFKVMAGFNQESSYQETLDTYSYNQAVLDVPAMSSGTGTIKATDSYSEYAIRGGFFRVNYNYLDKYLLEVNGRYDGSSKFPKSSRFGFFPSVSAGWQIAQERFMNSTRHWLDGLKLRASYGVIGNQNINPYTFTPSMSVNNKATSWIIDDTYVTSISSLPALVSQNFTWEKVGTINVGLDVNLFNNRLSGVFEWYQRNTNGMLAPGVQLPAVVGASAPYQNTADMRTRGWELSLNWRDQIGKVGYRIGFNLSDYKSEIIKYDDNAATKLLSSYYPGQTLGEIWGYVVDGYYTVDDFVDTSSWQLKEGVTSINGYNVRPGDVKFKNLRDDDTSTNVITSGDNTFDNPGDRKVIGNTTPRYQYGINLGMNYAGFDLNVILQGTGKRDYWISNVLTFPMNGDNFVPLFEGLSDYWMPKDPDNGDWSAVNPNAKYPRIYGNRGNSGSNLRQSDKYLSDASYLRIKNITLSYKLPKKWVNQIFLNQMKAFVSIENVATFTSLPSGIDPERIEWNYPAFRTVSFGVNITL